MIEWIITPGLTDFRTAERAMEDRVAAIAEGTAAECIWLIEHPPMYTAGTSAKVADLRDPGRFDVFETKRGGQYTYHGPGQRVAYVMLNVGARGHDVRAFVKQLEAWVIATLAEFNITGEIRFGSLALTSPRHSLALLPRTRSQLSVSVCENGSAFTVSRSMWNPILATLAASFPAALTNTALPALSILACPSPCQTLIWLYCAALPLSLARPHSSKAIFSPAFRQRSDPPLPAPETLQSRPRDSPFATVCRKSCGHWGLHQRANDPLAKARWTASR